MTAKRRVARVRTWPERAFLSGGLTAALLTLIGSVYVAHVRCDPHWVNRGGAAIVSIQAVAAVGEAHRRRRLADLRVSLDTNDVAGAHGVTLHEVAHALDAEIEKSERRALLTVLILAATGEVLHGFGDLFFDAFQRLL